MSDKKRKEYLSITTPRGIAHYPRLNKPETEVDGKPVPARYKCGIILDEEQVAPIRTKLEAKLKEVVAEFKAKNPKKAKSVVTYLPIRPAKDSEGDDIEGKFLITAKTYAEREDKKTGEVHKRRVPVFDSVGRKVTPVPNIGTGSEIKMAFTVGSYDKADRDKTEVGLTLYLDAVQLLKLVEFGGEGNAERYGFGQEEDGFTADESSEDSSDNYSSNDAGDEEDLPETDDIAANY